MYNPCPGVMEGVPSSNDYQGGFGTALMTKVKKIQCDIGKCTGHFVHFREVIPFWKQKCTVKPPIKDTLNKGNLCIKDTFQCTNQYSGNTFLPLKEDNLSKMDKMVHTNVSVIQRFHCIATIVIYIVWSFGLYTELSFSKSV